ncbi:MAG: hypothetical protein KAJ19_09435 [Gammaproteobacteria bacterium]|nr:hypothetical protein [Gammaproteobacteria bacterium]
MKRLFRERARILKQEGARLVEVTHHHGHSYYTIETPVGPRCVSASGTPTNVTIALKRFKKDVRKLLTIARQ